MPPYPAVKTDHPAEWHMQRFVEFTRYKQALGEPSPHMTIAGYLSQGVDRVELVWRAGVYACPYSVLTSEAIWREWPFERAVTDREGLRQWIHHEWSGFHIRTERRMVRTPAKFAESLFSWMDWMISTWPILITWGDDRVLYDLWYESIAGGGPRFRKGVHNFGRYITIRTVEFMRRYIEGYKFLELYDIRSIGGESPVRCLSLLYPDFADHLLVKKDAKVAELLGNDLLKTVRAEGLNVGHYTIAAMLCEYREAYEDRHQYPGRTIDQELDYLNGPKARWWVEKGHISQIWKARAELFPHQALGEVTGKWSGIRHDLSRVLRDRGYVWSDLLYSYPEAL